MNLPFTLPSAPVSPSFAPYCSNFPRFSAVQAAADSAYPNGSVTEEPNSMARKVARPVGARLLGLPDGAARALPYGYH